MEFRKKFVSLFSLTVLLLFASVGFNIYQHQQIKGLSEKITSENMVQADSSSRSGSAAVKNPGQSRKKDIAFNGKGGKTGADKIDELEYQLDAAEEEVDMATAQLSEELAKKEEYRKARNKLSSSLISDASRKRAMEFGAIQMAEEYDPLFKKLNISEEEFKKFKELLVERSSGLSDIAPLTGDTSEGEKKELLKSVNETYMNYNNKIRDLLGEENFQTYQYYSNRVSERRNVREFNETLPYDIAMTDEQADRLIDEMYDARLAVYTENPVKITEKSNDQQAMQEMMLERQKLTNKKYLEASRGILSSEQAEQYSAYLKKKTEMEESMMKMSNYLNDN